MTPRICVRCREPFSGGRKPVAETPLRQIDAGRGAPALRITAVGKLCQACAKRRTLPGAVLTMPISFGSSSA